MQFEESSCGDDLGGAYSVSVNRQTAEALEDRLLEFAAACGRAVDALPGTRIGAMLPDS
jgi:hypothetical protein